MVALALLLALGLASSTNALPTLRERRTPVSRPSAAFDLPLFRRSSPRLRTRDDSADTEVDLGDASDFLYTVGLNIGGTSTAAHLDTGSSDLWVISDACKRGTCKQSTSVPYPADSPTFNATGGSVTLQYGDSTTGTSASGPVGRDSVTIGSTTLPQQVFAAVNSTTNTVVNSGSGAAGIFGLGFPSESDIQESAVVSQFGNQNTTDDFVATTYQNGPLLSRLAMSGEIDQPMFAVSLQRDTIDVGGNDGVLTVGKLPDGVDNSSLTWVPVKLYPDSVGGLSAPSFAADETYPLRWEVELDAVFLDGTKLAATPQPSSLPGNTLSALLDTGNSLIRGPDGAVNSILSTVSSAYAANSKKQPTFPCSTPHTLAFQIGGQMFPVDPLDFMEQSKSGDDTECVAGAVVSTDPPSSGALFSWSLGDPFFKSTLVAFYYGNLTHPSVDPPRVGFMSTVSSNTTAAVQQAIADAQAAGGNFESTQQFAPSASAVATTVDVEAGAAASAPTTAPNAAGTSTVTNGAVSAGASPTASAHTSAASPLAASSSSLAFVVALSSLILIRCL